MLTHWETLEHQAMQEQWSYAQFLLALCELEVDRRRATFFTATTLVQQLQQANSNCNSQPRSKSLTTMTCW